MKSIGIIAGNGSLPACFARAAKLDGCRVIVVAHRGETDETLQQIADEFTWIKVGQLNRLIRTFKRAAVRQVAMIGGINRVRLFGGVRLDFRAMRLLARLRSAKDDVIMRGIAEELAGEGIEVVSSTVYLQELIMGEGPFTASRPSDSQLRDIETGVSALRAMSAEDIGQLVVVRDGVIVAVEAVEGSDAAIRRGGELGGPGCTVVKFAKATQDLRFDVPVIGVRTIETMKSVGATALAVEAGKCIVHDPEAVRRVAESAGISILGCSMKSVGEKHV